MANMVIPEAPPGQETFLVSVPPGTQPGAAVQAATPDGQVITFAVPADFQPGQVIPLFYTPLGRGPCGEIGVDSPPPTASPKTKAEIRRMRESFPDAIDRWKIDGQTMKGFFLHSESGYLYSWDQPSGTLYEYESADGTCNVVWKASIPSVNAEIWQTLPLPPTDPAALVSESSQSGEVPNMDAFLILTVAHETGRQLPASVLEEASDAFCQQNLLNSRAAQRLKKLPAAAQHFVIQNFRSSGSSSSDDNSTAQSEAFLSYVDKLLRRPRSPWSNSACTLVVHTAGAILGRCCPDLDALCHGADEIRRLAQAHCKIKSEADRFFISDMGTSEEGTVLDGFGVHDQWVGPLKTGSLLQIGPLKISIVLSDMAKDTPLPTKRGAQDSTDDAWQKKVYQVVKKEERTLALKRQQEYKDRAEERRQRSKTEAGSVAIDSLITRFNSIREAEAAAEEAAANETEMPTLHAQREANMAADGSFLGSGNLERAGIGFHSGSSADLIPNVLDPRNLSNKDRVQMKMQLRFEQLNRQEK